VHLGVCLNYYPRAGAASFRIVAGSLHTGEETLITGPTTGALSVVPGELRVDDRITDVVNRGMDVTFRVERKVRRGDALYRMDVVS
jgi:putative protease